MGHVVHCKREKYDVYIGRPSKWGNPFTIGKDGSRDEVCEKYEKWITEGDGKHLLKDLHELRDKILGCWCHPKRCHGDILCNLANTKIVKVQMGKPGDSPGAALCEGIIIESEQNGIGRRMYTIALPEGRIGCDAIKPISNYNYFSDAEYYCINDVHTPEEFEKAEEIRKELGRPLKILKWSDQKRWEKFYYTQYERDHNEFRY